MELLASGLNQRFLKTRAQIEGAVKKATQGAGAYLSVTIHEERTTERVQVGLGRPGANTRYEEKEKIHYRLEWARDESEIRKAQRSDGFFPLVDNTSLAPVEVLRTHKDDARIDDLLREHVVSPSPRSFRYNNNRRISPNSSRNRLVKRTASAPSTTRWS